MELREGHLSKSQYKLMGFSFSDSGGTSGVRDVDLLWGNSIVVERPFKECPTSRTILTDHSQLKVHDLGEITLFCLMCADSEAGSQPEGQDNAGAGLQLL